MPSACIVAVLSSGWQGALCSSAAEDKQQTDDSLFIGFLFGILLYTFTLCTCLSFFTGESEHAQVICLYMHVVYVYRGLCAHLV